MKPLRFLGLAVVAFAIAAAIYFAPGGNDAAAIALASSSLPLGDGSLMAIGLGGMIVNAANIGRLFVGFQTAFNRGFGGVAPMHLRVAMEVPSSTGEEDYAWLGQVPGFREWLGDRVVNNITAHGYSIKNKTFESTIGVPREKIEDDQYGVYAPLFEEMGRNSQAHPSQSVYAALKAGFTTTCYDGQYLFDTDHPVIQEDGSVASVANTDGGSGTPWFLLDASRAVKPIVFQNRKPYKFTAMNKDDDLNVFMRKQFLYGVDARNNVGMGLWQLAWGSKQTLNAANYAIARAALSGMKGDHGRPLGIMPNLLVVPPGLESAGRKLLNSENAAGGETNEWKGTAELLVVPWLA